ncbi:MAG: hypothetical protein K0Q60_1846 [Microvirga sp.]|jgi:hypothetical protein|nr:hypothetical protein [Microvirga sp.]
MFSQPIGPLTPGATYLEQAASDADQLAAEASASATASDARDSEGVPRELGPREAQSLEHKRRRAASAATHRQGGHESPTSTRR